MDSLKVSLPGKKLSCMSSPELVGFGDGFLVKGLVFLKSYFMSILAPATEFIELAEEPYRLNEVCLDVLN